MLEYLSEPWFDWIRPLMDNPVMGAPDFTVVYICDGGKSSETKHTQSFGPAGLIGWRVGSEPNPNLVVSRSKQIDMGDLLGRLSPSLVTSSTVLWQRSSLEVPRDVVGIGADHQRVVEGAQLIRDISIDLVVPDSPFGALTIGIRVSGCTVIRRDCLADDAAEVVVHTTFERAVQWLHDEDVLLGELIVEGWRVVGQLHHLSAIEGVVSAPSKSPADRVADAQFGEDILRYAALRQSRSFMSLMDETEAATSDPAILGPL